MLFAPKVSAELIHNGMARIAARHPGKHVTLLVDDTFDRPDGALDVVDCRTTSLDAFEGRDFLETAYLYACSSDETGAPFIEAVIAQGGAFLPVHEAVPSSYVHMNDVARRVLEDEFQAQQAEGFAKWDFGPHDFVNLLQAVDLTRALQGDFVEIGCYRGSSGSVAMRYMRERGIVRDCYFFDVFEGFTYDTAVRSADSHWAGTHVTEGVATVEARLRRHEAPGSGPSAFVARCNIIDDDLPAQIERICLANIDVDLYEAVGAALAKVAPLVVPGGVIIVEDPGHTPLLIGARVALTQFLRTELASAFTPIYMQSGQTFLIRMR